MCVCVCALCLGRTTREISLVSRLTNFTLPATSTCAVMVVVPEDRSSRDRTQFGTHQQAGGGLARGMCRDLVRRVGEGFPALSIRGLVSFRTVITSVLFSACKTPNNKFHGQEED